MSAVVTGLLQFVLVAGACGFLLVLAASSTLLASKGGEGA